MVSRHATNCDILQHKTCSCGTAELDELARPKEFSDAWDTDLRLFVEGKDAWPDLKDQQVIHISKGVQVAGLPSGTQNKSPAVAIRVDLEDGQVVIVETSIRLLYTAVKMLAERYGVGRFSK